MDQGADIAVAEARSGELSTRDSLEQSDVVWVREAQGADAALVVGHGAGDGVEQLGAGGGVVNGGQGIEVGVVGALGKLGPAMEIGDALAQRPPDELALGPVVEGAEDFEVAGAADGGFNAQHAAGLVVHLDGVAPDPVLDANTLGAVLHGRGLEDRLVQGVGGTCDGIALEVGPSPASQLPSQPLAAIEADLDAERKPGLQAHAHEAELGMKEVLVEVEASSLGGWFVLPLPSYPKRDTVVTRHACGVTSQLRRAITSVPTNIAEGSRRDGRQEYVRFLNIAQGSAAKAEYLLILARDLEYLSPAAFERLVSGLDEVARMLHGLRVKVEGA